MLATSKWTKQQNKQDKDLKKTFRFHGHSPHKTWFYKALLQLHKIQAFMTASYFCQDLMFPPKLNTKQYSG
jgi:hypothetical protein